jgi:hypothetical protein
VGTKNQTTTATTQLPGYVNDAYKALISRGQDVASTAYTPYTGGFTPDQQQAFENIRSMWGASDPSFSAASDAFGRSMVPTYDTVSQYMSPYMDEVVSKAMANMQEQNAQQQQQVVGDAIAKGAMGGNRVGVAQAELARQQKLADNQAIANLYQQGYQGALGAAQADKSAAQAAGQGFAGLGATQMQTNLAQAASQLGAGTQQQQFDYQQYLNKLAFPYQQTGWLASLVGGLGSTAGGTTKQTTPQGNIFSQLLGAGLGIASLFKDGGAVKSPLDVDMAREPVRIMRPNPFGFWGDYDAAPALEKGRDDRLWMPLNPVEFDADARGRPKLAVGGVPFANDNGDFPSYASGFGSLPFANDNGDFGGYIPKAVAIGGGRGNFPTIQQPAQQEDVLSKYGSTLKEGASNIKGWLSPQVRDTINPRTGLTGIFAHGGVVGRRGYAAGGRPTPAEVEALYEGIILPEGGLVGAPVLPERVRNLPIVDAANPLNGDRLGLDVDTTLPPRGEDPYLGVGDGEMPYAPLPERPVPNVPGGNLPGQVIYGRGDQFVTNPRDDGYSRNGFEALQSLFAGKGLNLAPDANFGLAKAGAAMAASKSPFFLQGVGEGTSAGLDAWKEYQAMERDNAKARAEIGQKGEELAQQALKTGADVAYTGANTLATDTATQRDRFDYKYTPLGVQVTDKITGMPGPIYPYGSMLPTGEIAERPKGQPGLFATEAPGGHVDPRLMTEAGAGQALGQADAVIKTQQVEAAAAQNTQQLLQEMKHNLAKLPPEGIMTPGKDFKERADFAKGINTYLQVFGMQPYFPEGEIAAAEDLNKLTNRLGFDLSRMLGSNEAASVVMTGIESVPGGANSREGANRIIAGLEAANKRRIDLYHFTQDWAAKNAGSIYGAEEYFNRANPPELYALSSYVPLQAMEYLRAHPEFAEAFNQKYGDGRDVARFVLGQ